MTPTTQQLPPLGVTILESRDVPSAASFGTGWIDPENITVSFAKDKTSIGTSKSELSHLFRKVSGGESAWQREILRAFQTWASVTNVNFGLVKDSSEAFGSAGEFQGDLRFGDIRIGAASFPGTLANAVAVDWANGTWSGDILFNKDQSFGINPAAGSKQYDLYTVALHEIGHTLGLMHSTDPNSVMSESYVGRRTGLSASDISTVRSFYNGERQADLYDQTASNHSTATATQLTGAGNITVSAELTTANDVDVYSFVVPANQTKFTIRLQTTGLSLLTAGLTLIDDRGRTVDQDSTVDPTRGDLEIKVSNATPGARYHLRVTSASGDFGVGRYQLEIQYRPSDKLKTTFNTDQGSNESMSTAVLLSPETNGRSGQQNGHQSSYNGVIESKTDADYYRVAVPADLSGDQSNLAIQLRGLNSKRIPPTILVLDSNQQIVSARVISNYQGAMTLLVSNIRRGDVFYIRVAGDGTDTLRGNYRLGVDFTKQRKSEGLDQLWSGGITSTQKQVSADLTVNQTALFQFELTTKDQPRGSKLILQIFNARGQVVFSLEGGSDRQPGQGTIKLTPGAYSVRLIATFPKDTSDSVIWFRLAGGAITDPMGPVVTTTSTNPITESPPPNLEIEVGSESNCEVPPSSTSPESTTEEPDQPFLFIPLISQLLPMMPYSF